MPNFLIKNSPEKMEQPRNSLILFCDGWGGVNPFNPASMGNRGVLVYSLELSYEDKDNKKHVGPKLKLGKIV